MEEDTIKSTTSMIEVINNLFSSIFSSVDNSIYEILDKITFIETDIIDNERFRKILGNNSSTGIIMICNALILGIILFFVIGYLFSHLTGAKIQRPDQFFFKAIIFVALMNNSYWICSQIINIISLISKEIQNIRVQFI